MELLFKFYFIKFILLNFFYSLLETERVRLLVASIYTQRQIELTSFTFAISARQKKSKTDEFFLKLTQAKDYLSSMV